MKEKQKSCIKNNLKGLTLVQQKTSFKNSGGNEFIMMTILEKYFLKETGFFFLVEYNKQIDKDG